MFHKKKMLSLVFSIFTMFMSCAASDVDKKLVKKQIFKSVVGGALGVTAVAILCKPSLFTLWKSFPLSFELIADCIIKQFSPEQVDFEEDDIKKKKYAYAYLWYESIHKKYSTANLNKYFFTSFNSTNEEYYEFQEIDKFESGGHWILSSSKYLHLIDQLYRKKLNGGSLTYEENLTLDTAEWLILRALGHLKHKTILTQTIVAAVITLCLEFGYQKSVKPSISNGSWPTSIGLSLIAFKGTSYVFDFINNFYVRFTEARADNFANQLADTKALQAAKLTLIEKNKKCAETSGSWFSTQPSYVSRIAAIENKLAQKSKLK